MVDEHAVTVVPQGLLFRVLVLIGQFLTVLSIIGTGIAVIWAGGAAVQKIEDAVVHEAEIRQQTVQSLTGKIDALTLQEGRDMTDVKQQISDLRADVRRLVFVPQGKGR